MGGLSGPGRPRRVAVSGADGYRTDTDFAEDMGRVTGNASGIAVVLGVTSSAGYRARVPVFCDDLTNIANLASSTARNSGLARQDIQVINTKYELTIRAALDGVTRAREKEVRTGWPSAEWWRSWNADWSNKEQYEFTFFERSANAGVALLRAAEQLREWVLTFQPDSAAAQALDRDVAEMGGKVQDNGLAVGIVASPGAVSKTGR